MNFLIFRDFFEFIWIFKFKTSFLYRMLMWQLIRRANDVSSHGDMCTRHVAHKYACLYMCVCVCVCARVSVISGVSILFRIFAKPT